jgi:hypothetical protein
VVVPVVVAGVVFVAVVLVVVPVVLVVVPVVPVVPVGGFDPGSPGPVQAQATPPPPARHRTLVATATALRCFLVIEASFGLVTGRPGTRTEAHAEAAKKFVGGRTRVARPTGRGEFWSS